MRPYWWIRAADIAAVIKTWSKHDKSTHFFGARMGAQRRSVNESTADDKRQLMVSRVTTLLTKSAFLRNVGMLMTGSIIAQAIMALSLPILTRLYVPEDFTLLAVFTSTLGLLSVAACLRFNIAVPIPADDDTAANLLVLALVSAVTSVAVIATLTLLAPHVVIWVLRQPKIESYLWLLPAGTAFFVTYDVLQYWASRKRRYGLITRTLITRAVSGAGSQIGIGAVVPGPIGLILGQAIYSGMGVAGLTFSVWKDRQIFAGVTRATLCSAARRYRQFPLYSVPEVLFNKAGSEVPMLIIAAVAAKSEAGFLMLATRTMGLPMTLIGNSIAQVYLSEAPNALAEGRLRQTTYRIMRTLLVIGGPLLLLVGVTAPLVFHIVFGALWTRAGVIVAWLTPMFILQLVASPVSMTPHIMGKVNWAMGLQIAGGVIRIGAVALVGYIHPRLSVEAFAISGALFYAIAIGLTGLVLRVDN